MLAWARGDFGRAEVLGAQARLLAGDHRLVFGMAASLYLLFLAAEMQGRRDDAIALGEEAVARMRESGQRAWLAYSLSDVGTRLVEEGDRERGEAWVAEGLALHRELGNKHGAGNKLNDLGLVSHQAGDVRAAARHYGESVRLLWEAGDAWYLASPVEGLAAVAVDAGQAGQAARLLGAAAALRGRSGSTVWPAERARLGRAAAATRAALGEEGYAREAAAGRALPLADVVAAGTAVADALLAPPSAAPPPSPAEVVGLSPREQEVLRLLAAGRSNPEIAAAPFIGRATVKTHVVNILAKLGARTRTEAAAIAHHRGLL
jgi:DNA-binding CsgD family transcriptional regulator